MSKGFAPIIVVVVVVILALGAGGYFLSTKSGNKISLPSSTSLALNPNCKYNDPDLCKFVNNWKGIKNYGAKSTFTSSDGKKMESNFEISEGEKFHMVSSDNGKENMNIITIGDTNYTKDYTDNKWWKQKTPKTTGEIKDKLEFKIDDTKEAEDKTTYKAVGKEACSSKQCFKYQVISPDMKDITEYIFFDDREYLLRKTRTETKEGTDELEFVYDNINISEPSPTKNAADGQAIIPGLDEKSQKEVDELNKQAESISKQAEEESRKLLNNNNNESSTPEVDYSGDSGSEGN